MKKHLIRLLLFILIVLCIPIPSVYAAKAKAPKLSAASAILIDAETGYALYSKNANRKMYPASTTKIISYLVISDAIENGELALEDMLVFTREMQDNMPT